MVRGLLFSASRVRRKLRLRTRRAPVVSTTSFPSSGVVERLARAACSAEPSERPPATLLNRAFVLLVGTAGFEPATPCSQSQIGRDRHLGKR
jgi:hypothetical protein